MKHVHVHEYEAVSHPVPSPGARSLGIKSAEIRKCRKCEKEMPFILAKDRWVALFEDPDADDQEILLA
jgi:hypothetical protein